MTGTFKGGPLDPNTPDSVARDGASHRVSNITTALVSLVALAFSAFSLWETSLKQADLSLFVPPVIHFAQPYNTTNFEVIEVPVTMVNDGARSGTVLGLSLAVTDPRSKAIKHFYAADLGRWTMEQTRASATSRSRRSRSPETPAVPRPCCSTRAATSRSRTN